jgi:hypothetical protein
MAKHFLAIAFLAVLAHASGQTTEDEYRYLVNEHAVLARNGLIKPGYDMVELGHWGLKDAQKIRDFKFSGLVKSNAKNKILAILVDYEQKKNAADTAAIHKYYCIPHMDSSERVRKLAYDDFIRINDFEVFRAYCWALTQYVQYAFSNPD